MTWTELRGKFFLLWYWFRDLGCDCQQMISTTFWRDETNGLPLLASRKPETLQAQNYTRCKLFCFVPVTSFKKFALSSPWSKFTSFIFLALHIDHVEGFMMAAEGNKIQWLINSSFCIIFCMTDLLFVIYGTQHIENIPMEQSNGQSEIQAQPISHLLCRRSIDCITAVSFHDLKVHIFVHILQTVFAICESEHKKNNAKIHYASFRS